MLIRHRLSQRDGSSDFPWIRDRWRVVRSQGIDCGLHDRLPGRYPVLCAPILDPRGHGLGRRLLNGDRDHARHCREGWFWMAHRDGERIYSDFAVVAGEGVWCRHTVEVPGGADGSGYWVVQDRSRPRLEHHCLTWIRSNLAGYTGMLNIETIAGRIIDARSGVSDRWPDLYGRKWSDAVLRLYEYGTWDLLDAERADGYSLDLFGPRGQPLDYPDGRLMAHAATVGISSVRLCGDVAPGECPEVRLAVINCFNLQVGLRIRLELARDFELLREREAAGDRNSARGRELPAAHLRGTSAASLAANSLSNRL